MNKELFGVFGAYETFDQLRPNATFDEVVDGEVATVGIRDPGLGATGWSASYEGTDGACLVWGENYVSPAVDGRRDEGEHGIGDGNGDETNTARWLLERYATEGLEALSGLNGSYLVFLEYDGEAFVATDPVRSRECFYTDEPGVRAFGTDAAAVAGTIETPEIRFNAVLEFLHMGVVLGEKTTFEGLSRLPIDSYLTPTTVEPLERFVYDPIERDRESEYARELADRLERAIERRAQLPGRKGLLLSSGYDSRTLLSGIPDIERCYTVGDPSAQEVRGAKRLARQYDAAHTAFPPDERYLLADADKVRYSQGIKESLHIHHAGYADEMATDVDTVYHGLLCDTFFRGHFNAEDTVEVLGKQVPVNRLDPDPNPVDTLLNKFGYAPATSRELMNHVSPELEDPDNFVRAVVREEFDRVSDRADSVQNALNCCGIDNQPSIPFHGQLSDTHFASFLAVDTELIDWHLTTPPEYRTTKTFLEACRHLDESMLRYQPPDRPRETQLLNDIEGFVRRKAPFLEPFEPPWPNRERVFEVYDIDRRLLPDHEHLYDLPARHKLRLHDVVGWMQQCSEPSAEEIERLFEPNSLLA
ncbi:hypothetical protein OB955_15545 [Halobacteria archaeon AArc-m2/3/4]|uniref:Asparagine synthase (Glutamine-hydrolysing) n=1 Tax=Natronoglomus mannanivorans TaxID=2979990 RepID=A0ABT2QGU1_9EURY|nr:hypothetical protein [Halobacteria archaeon AArc-m2/3/4]